MPARNRQLALLLAIISTVMIGWVLHVGAAILQPLVIALLLASMLQPVVVHLKRWRIPPVVTITAMVVALFFGAARFGLLMRDNLVVFLGQSSVAAAQAGTDLSGAAPPGEAGGAPLTLPEQQAEETPLDESSGGEPQVEPAGPTLDPFSQQAEQRAQASGGWPAVVADLGSRMRNSRLPEQLVSWLITSLENLNLQALAGDLLGGGFGFASGLVLVLIYMLFIFAEAAVFKRKILAVSGDRAADAAQVLDTIGKGIQRYLGVKTVTSMLTGSICYLGLLLIGIPFALMFGFLAFLLNYIPTFGSIIAGIFPTVTALALEPSIEKALLVVALYLVVNLTLGSFLEPKILGHELNLSPLVLIVSVVVWGGLWGVVGAFLAVPLTASTQIVLASMETTRPIAMLLSSGPPRDEGPRRRGER